jgi:hypothetical protein
MKYHRLLYFKTRRISFEHFKTIFYFRNLLELIKNGKRWEASIAVLYYVCLTKRERTLFAFFGKTFLFFSESFFFLVVYFSLKTDGRHRKWKDTIYEYIYFLDFRTFFWVDIFCQISCFSFNAKTFWKKIGLDLLGSSHLVQNFYGFCLHKPAFWYNVQP